jgi:hypothetical protein
MRVILVTVKDQGADNAIHETKGADNNINSSASLFWAGNFT